MLLPPTYLSLYQRVLHKSMRPPLYPPQLHETSTFSRPQRDQKPPSRFMYYSAGEPFSCSNVFTNSPPSAVIPPKPLWFWVPTPSILPNDVTSATTNVVLPLPAPTPIPNCLQNSYSSTDAIFVCNRTNACIPARAVELLNVLLKETL